MTVERPMFSPVDPTRRHLLTVAAVGAVAAAIPTGALAVIPVADPIYAATERHKDLAKAYDQAWKLRGHCKDFGTLTEDGSPRM
jgi:hypothetical protein